MTKNHKADVILISIIVGLGLLLGLVFFVCSKDKGQVVVTVDGEEYGTYSIDNNQEIAITGVHGSNLLVINDRTAYIKDASCPDKLCVHMGRISRTGQSIICLPNKVVVEIKGMGEDSEDIDAVVGGTTIR